jgi:lysophospholipase L1-like esterase
LNLNRTNRTLFATIASQGLLIGCAITMGLLSRMPWLATFGIVLLGFSLGAQTIASRFRFPKIWPWEIIAWLGTCLVPATVLLAREHSFTLDPYHAVIAWLIAAALCLSAIQCADSAARNRWKTLTMMWLFIGGFALLTVYYLRNQSRGFYIGLALNLAILVLCKLWLRLTWALVQIVNTYVLLLIGLPIADWVIRPAYSMDPARQSATKYYSYNVARKDPVAFANWWRLYRQQWEVMAKDIFMKDPSGTYPFLLRPSSRGFLFQCPISINSKGFRGKEFSDKSTNIYRIVVVGESTTFGITLNPDDHPWPELLEEMVRDRLKLSKTVQVINAGGPAYDIHHTLCRLQNQILPLSPDMVIAYHGVNGFALLHDSLPRLTGPLPPAYEQRPLRLLADAEYALKIRHYRRQLFPNQSTQPPVLPDVMKTSYADEYHRLIQAARTNNIKVVLATFPLAANERSPSDVIEFYRSGYPSIYYQMRANVAHSTLIRNLAHEDPQICLADPRARLDGDHEKFIDLVHYTQEGRRLVAEAFFEGIKGVLETELGSGNADAAGNKPGH